MKSKSAFFVAAICLAAFSGAQAQTQQQQPTPAVRAFVADAEHCFYVVDYPENSGVGYTARFTEAVQAAVAELTDPASSHGVDAALYALRDRCAASLETRFK